MLSDRGAGDAPQGRMKKLAVLFAMIADVPPTEIPPSLALTTARPTVS
jgi:hypothetical protein